MKAADCRYVSAINGAVGLRTVDKYFWIDPFPRAQTWQSRIFQACLSLSTRSGSHGLHQVTLDVEPVPA